MGGGGRGESFPLASGQQRPGVLTPCSPRTEPSRTETIRSQRSTPRRWRNPGVDPRPHTRQTSERANQTHWRWSFHQLRWEKCGCGGSSGARAGVQVRTAEPRWKACSVRAISVRAPPRSPLGGWTIPGSRPGRLPSRLVRAARSTAPAPATFSPRAATSQRRVSGPVLSGGWDGTTRSRTCAPGGLGALGGLSVGSLGGEGREGTRS